MAKALVRDILHVFPTFAVGGSQSRFAQLVRILGDRYRHTVIALDGNFAMADRLPSDGTLIYYRKRLKSNSTFSGAWKAKAIIDEIKPDTLVTYNWGAMEWCIAKRFIPKLKHVHIEDGFGPEEQSHLFFRRNITRRLVLANASTKVVVPSKTLEAIARKKWRIPKLSLQYVPNGIDCQKFGVGIAAPSDTVTIGTVATLRPEKNIFRLIELFCKAASRTSKELKLIIVGDGPDRPKLEEAAAVSSFSRQITFVGGTHSPESWLRVMDIFALTSNTEQMPLSVLEAMATGLPIVSFDVGDIVSMVSESNRRMVAIPLQECDQFIRSLCEFAFDRELRKTVGDNNRAKAKMFFDESNMARAYLELFG